MSNPTYRDAEKAILPVTATVKAAIQSMNESAALIVLVTDEDGRLAGVVTDGDIRRALIAGIEIDSPVDRICNRHPKCVAAKTPALKAEELALTHNISRVPVLDDESRPVGIYYLEDFLKAETCAPKAKTTPVVIMAGGRGTRLEPFTRILPKPLIPIGSKATVEVIIDSFFNAGFSRFILSLNYRKEFIKTYFAELEPLPYTLTYVEEDKPLNTIGSLSLMGDLLKEPFIVANCDMLLDLDWDDVLKFHRERGHVVTMLAALKEFKIPYGIIDIQDEKFAGVTEKPEYNFLINLGVYVISPEVLGLMPEGEPMSAIELLDAARASDMTIGVYPVYNKWFDVGQWEEYKNTLSMMEM